jgi:hypothetical protein
VAEIEIPDSLSRTAKGKNFVLFDSEPADQERMFILGTRKNLKVLKSCKLCFIDGTFKTSPHLFHQLYTIHGMYKSEILPMVYGLLPNKTGATYERFFRQIKSMEAGLAPETALMDFEAAVMKAFRVSTNTSSLMYYLCMTFMSNFPFTDRIPHDAVAGLLLPLLPSLDETHICRGFKETIQKRQ